MPYGLKGAPATFQILMTAVLSGIQGIKCLVYLDDVIFGQNLETHNDRLREVLSRLRTHNLNFQPDKRVFFRKEVSYLGHVIGPTGVRPDEKRVMAVRDFTEHKTTHELKGFLGLAGYYRRFVPKFSKVPKPLKGLLKKNVPYDWTEKSEAAFVALKTLLTTEPLLQCAYFTRPFVLTTDASNDAIGAVFSQEPIGKHLTIAYASRTLINAERNYPTIQKELLAIVLSCKYFRQYLSGRKFTIVKDHRPLTWIFSVKNPSSRLLRWRLKLEEYEYEVKYKKGSSNNNDDALSRIHLTEDFAYRQDVKTEPTQEKKLALFRECMTDHYEGISV
jgi:hypothetical protein